MEKAIIYLRTSTKDQNPELQKEDCVRFCEENKLEVDEIVIEQGSAYKLEKKRLKWEGVIKKAKKEKKHIVVWRYDRAFRNREEFYKFMKVMFEVYGKKVYSVKETSIISFWDLIDKSHSDNPVFNELLNGIFRTLWDFMIQQAGEEAEEESKKKSSRIKLAVRKTNGVTRSYKGKKWGRKSMNKRVYKDIIKLHNEGKKIREIAAEVYYWDKNSHKKFVSHGFVHKTIVEYKEKENTPQENQQSSNL